MNQLVIIGNGFDLAHGLKTSYKDFILWCLNEAFKYERECRSFDEARDLIWIHEQYYSDKVFENLEDFTSLLSYSGIKPSYNKFFKTLIDNLKSANWVDIEKFYFNELYSIVYAQIKADRNILDPYYIQSVKRLNNSLDIIKKYLEIYLSNIDTQNIKYFSGIKSRFNDIFKLTGKRETGESAHFLNFNYTSTIEKYFRNGNLEIEDKLYTINHIHGEINSETNPIVFGYGDEMNSIYEQIENYDENELTRNLKSFHYLLSSNYQDLFDFIEDGEFSVTIMGHSCGLSDRVLFNNIFQHKNLKEIQIYYHQRGENKYDNDFFEKTQNISRYFDSQSKHLMRYKIVPFCKCSPLVQ